jgi:glycosyltransferase involved in cell wall biosynthesis
LFHALTQTLRRLQEQIWASCLVQLLRDTIVRVSALIPAYNRRPYIVRAINSILAQTLPVDEIIVVDDGSTDGTSETIRSLYGAQVKVLRQENGGVSAARRLAVEAARGDWIAFLDSDDEWLPGRNAALLRAASMIPSKVAWIFGDTRFVTDQGEGSSIFAEYGLTIEQNPRVFNNPLVDLVWDPGRPRASVLQSSLIQRSVLIELQCFSEGLRHGEDFLAGMQVATRYLFAAISPVVTRLHRTSDLKNSSLEGSLPSSGDRYEAMVKGYAVAARSTGDGLWGRLHAQSVRGLCKWRAQNDLPIRRLAWDQFTFGFSIASLAFFSAAMLGTSFFQVGFAMKRRLRRYTSENS